MLDKDQILEWIESDLWQNLLSGVLKATLEIGEPPLT